MPKRVLRQQPRISYYEPEEPPLDEHVFCESCGDFVYEYCSIHGPLLVVPDDKVNRNGVPAIVPRAALTIPKVFLHLAPSIIPGAGLGVFATLTLPRGVRFGPYRGKRTAVADSMYCWQIYDNNQKPSHVVDAIDSNSSNWMRYVNCARHWREQNLVAFQYRGELYYRTIKIIPRFTELMVFYGSVFARELQVDLATYNSPAGYAQKFGAPPIKKRKTNETKPQHETPKTSEETASNIETTNKISSSNLKSEPEHKHDKNNKIKPTFGKNNRNKKETTKLNKIVKTKTVQKKNEKTVKTTIKNVNKDLNKLPLKSAITEKTEIKINNTIPLKPVINSTLNTNNNKPIDLYKYCEVCNLKCITEDVLKKHMRFHDNSRPHVCNVCHYRFGSLSHLNNHKVSIHNVGKTKEYICDICNYKTIRKSNLTRHFRTHAGEKPFNCDICHYRCVNKENMNRHVRTHTGEKPYACNICDYRCIQKGTLNYHMRTHTGEKPYSCNICNYRCVQRGALILHIRTHTGEKPFSCNVCNYTCIQKGHLNSHMRTHTGEKPFSCNICDYRCERKGDLNSHLRKHTGEKPFSCDICDFSSHSISLKPHLLSKHINNKQN